MKLTLSQAAKESGKVKSTIQKAIKSGRLSASKGENGHYEIDPAELFRVFPSNGEETTKLNDRKQQETPPSNTAETDLLRERIAELKADLEHERENAAEWRKQAQTLALTQAKPAASGLLGRLFGKG